MVQLKGKSEGIEKFFTFRFQFLNGTIKRSAAIRVNQRNGMFQFLNGTIKRALAFGLRLKVGCFNS